MLRVLYLVHDLCDPAVRRRVLMLQAGGATVTLAGFRRGATSLAVLEGIEPIELGVTEDARFAQRVFAVARAAASLGRSLRDVSRPDVILARNLEMLALADRASARFDDAPVVYECLDVHRLLLRDDGLGRAMRATERLFGRRVALLVTSSPAFIENYFGPLSGVRAPTHLVENRVLELDGPVAAAVRRDRPDDAPWRIGWFGAIRCRKSLALLSQFTRQMEGRFEVVLRGRPAYSEFDDFDGAIAREPFIRFEGPYRNPEDLAAIYADVDFSWAIDFFEEGLNSRWLLPNRLYEGCRHGALPIVLEGTETARMAHRRDIGVVLPDARPDTLVERLGALDAATVRTLAANLAHLGPRPWIIDRADCAAFVERLASLRQKDAATAMPQPLASFVSTRVDCHDR